MHDQAGSDRSIFREAALEAHRRGEQRGRPLYIISTWTRLAVAATLLAVISGLIFAASVRVGEYAEGVAVVRREGRVVVSSAVAGTVQEIAARPGQRVREGQLLVRLDDTAQRAELERLERAYELALVELLREPSAEAERKRVAALDGERRVAAARLRERSILAPAAGVVSDLRVRPGQAVVLGDAVVALEGERARTVVVGLFPGSVRPLLGAADTRVFLELDGFPDGRHEVEIRSIADEVVGPGEALRYLGRDHQGALELSGPLVVVETELPSERFVADEVEYRLYDGMQGRLETKLRARTLLETLIPALQRL